MSVCVKSLSCVRLFATPWTVAHQAPVSMGFSRQEYNMDECEKEPAAKLGEYLHSY